MSSKSASPPRHLALGIALILALALVLTAGVVVGCGSDSSSSDASASPAAGAGAPEEMRIAYQLIPNGDLIVKDQGWLEAALPDTTITWVKFDSGADVNTAVIAGSVDIGLAGSSPVAAGLSSPMNIPYKVPWIHDVIGAAESLIVKNDAGVTDVTGLEGKKVGTPFGSTAHYSACSPRSRSAGVDPTKVKLIDLQPPDILAAWQRGDIDAAYVWNPTLADLKKDGTVLVTSAELADARQAHRRPRDRHQRVRGGQYPDAVQTWVDQQNKAVELYRSDPQAAGEAVGRQLNITADEALAQMKDLIFLTSAEQAGADYLGTPEAPGKLAENLESAAQFLKTQGSVETVPPLTDFQADLANQFVAAALQ